MEKNIQWIKSKQPCPKLKLKMEGKKDEVNLASVVVCTNCAPFYFSFRLWP